MTSVHETATEADPSGSASFTSAAQLLVRREAFVLLAIVALGCALRLIGLGDAWLNPDEGIYYSMTAWRDSAKFWEELAANAHPPLYYLMLRGIADFTPDFWYYRALSVVSGVLAIPALYWFARTLWGRASDARPELGRAVALLAALALALAPGHIVISQIIRPYAFLTCTLALTCASALAYLRGARWWTLLVYVLSIALALLTHYSAFLIAPPLAWLALHALLSGGLRGKRLAVFAGVQLVPIAIVAALYFLHLRPRLVDSALADQALAEGGWLTPFLIDSISGFWTHTVGVLGFGAGEGAEAAVVLLFVLGALLLGLQRRWRTLGLVGAVWLCATGLSALGKYPFGASRHSSWTLLFFVLPIAYALRPLLARRAFVLPIVLAVLAAPSVFVSGAVRKALRLGAEPQQIATENPVPRSSVQAFVSRVMPRIDNVSGHVLMDMQSYYTLLPFYGRARESARASPNDDAPDAKFFLWGKHEASVAWRWQMSVVSEHAGQAQHILELIRVRDASTPEGPRLADQEEVVLIWAGWPCPSSSALAQADSQRPEGERWIRSAFVEPGIRVYVFRLKAFLASMRRGR